MLSMLTLVDDLADVTLIDEDTKSILTDDVNKEIPSKYDDACGATRWPNFLLMQVAQPGG